MKRIFRYLKGTPSLGLYYPKFLGFNLKGYLDSDYASCNMDRKSTSVMNSKKPLTLDFKTFTKCTGLDYNRGTYVSHPSPEAEKAGPAKIITNEVLGESYSSIKQINSIQQMIAYCLVTRTKVDIALHLSDDDLAESKDEEFEAVSYSYKEQPESSHARDTDAFDSESSSCLETFRPYDNFIVSLKGYWSKIFNIFQKFYMLKLQKIIGQSMKRYQTNKLIQETMSNLDKISKAGVDERAKLLRSLNRISKTLKVDSALKEEMKKMTESNTTISRNITNLIELLINAQLLEHEDIETKKAKEESVRASRASLISTVIPITRPNPETRLIEFSSRPPLTDITLKFLVSKPEIEIIGLSSGPVIDITLPEQPESPPVFPKADKGKGIATHDTKSP
ncbi:hypothetical protein Tco_0500979 [Tanacetum coccineum]